MCCPPFSLTYITYKGIILAPLCLIKMHIRWFHAQGVSYEKMVPMLRKHYDTDSYGLRCVSSSFPPLECYGMIPCWGVMLHWVQCTRSGVKRRRGGRRRWGEGKGVHAWHMGEKVAMARMVQKYRDSFACNWQQQEREWLWKSLEKSKRKGSP